MQHRVRKRTRGALLFVYLEQRHPERNLPRRGLVHDAPGAMASVLYPGDSTPRPIQLVPGHVDHAVEGGFVEVDSKTMPGLYAIAPGDAVFDTGSDRAVIMLQFDGTRDHLIEMDLVDYDPDDGHALGLRGFAGGVRHEHLTSIFGRVMEPAITEAVRERDTASE